MVANAQQLLLINEICDEFEERLKQDEFVSVESSISQTSKHGFGQEASDFLLIELLVLKIQYAQDQDAEASRLCTLHPKHAGKIRKLLSDSSRWLDQESEATSNIEFSLTEDHRFEVRSHFASGGLGDVFIAYDKHVQRKVALKTLKPKYLDSQEALSRFCNEASITGELEHPGIVPVYDSGTTSSGRPYYAMRLLKGETLKDSIAKLHDSRQSRDFSRNQRALLRKLIDTCDAIAYAHDHGVIHRDLKPANILIGRYGETVVIDWGLARTESKNVDHKGDNQNQSSNSTRSFETRVGSVLGTPEYMSPEQASGDSKLIGKSSDVYGLGAVLFSILTGSSPTENVTKDTRKRVDQARSAVTVSARERLESVPPGLDAICSKAMSYRPEQRYESPQLLGVELENWLSDRPIVAKRDSWMDWTARFLRKHRRWAAAAAATLFLIAIGSLIFASVIEGQRKELQTRKEAATQARNDAIEEKNIAQAAKTKADQASKKFQEEAKTNAQMLNVITEAFISVNPDEGSDSEMTAKDVLLRAHSAIKESELEGLSRARILDSLSGSFASVAVYDLAISTGQEALDLRKANLGDDHILVLDSMANQVRNFRLAGRNNEAMELGEKALSLSRNAFGPKHDSTIVAMQDLAHCYNAAGRFKESLEIREKTLKLSQEKKGFDHPLVIASMSNLASSYRDMGMDEEALALSEKTLELSKQKKGINHPFTLFAMASLATSYGRAGRIEEKIKLERDSLELMKKKFGSDHPHTISMMHNLAVSYRRAGQNDQALELQEKALKLVKAKLGSDHPDTIDTMRNLAIIYDQSGRIDEAIALKENTIKNSQNKLGPEHPSTLGAAASLANSFIRANRIEEAIELYEKTLKSMQKVLERDHPTTIKTMGNLAKLFSDAGQFEESTNLYEKLYEVQKKKFGQGHSDTLFTMNCLAISLSRSNRIEESLELMVETFNLMQKHRGWVHDSVPENIGAILGEILSQAQAHLSKHEFSKAEKSLRLMLKHHGPRKDKIASVHRQLHLALLGQRKWKDGIEAIGQWEKTLRKSSSGFGKLQAWVDTSRAVCQLELGKLEEAKASAQKAIGNESVTGSNRHRANSVLSVCLAKQKEFDQAIEKSVEAFEGLESIMEAAPPQLLWYISRAAERVANVYELAEKSDEAKKWQAKTADIESEIETLIQQDSE